MPTPICRKPGFSIVLVRQGQINDKHKWNKTILTFKSVLILQIYSYMSQLCQYSMNIKIIHNLPYFAVEYNIKSIDTSIPRLCTLHNIGQIRIQRTYVMQTSFYIVSHIFLNHLCLKSAKNIKMCWTLSKTWVENNEQRCIVSQISCNILLKKLFFVPFTTWA